MPPLQRADESAHTSCRCFGQECYKEITVIGNMGPSNIFKNKNVRKHMSHITRDGMMEFRSTPLTNLHLVPDHFECTKYDGAVC